MLVDAITDYAIYMLDLQGSFPAGIQEPGASRAMKNPKLSASTSLDFTLRSIGTQVFHSTH
jgi:hypothetical protein